MLNHVRTLLLNLSYDGNGAEHIPSSFLQLPLPAPFSEVNAILFPSGSSRSYKQFLAHHYLNIIRAAGLEERLKDFDSRISYPLDRSDFFKIHRNSNPFVSNSAYPIFVYGKFRGNETNDSFYDNFEITQVSNTTKVLIYSTVRKKYMNGNSLYDTAEVAAENQLSFVDNLSVPIIIGSTGISFSIDGGATFTGTANKSWQFLVESPFETQVVKIINALSNLPLERLFQLPSRIDTKTFENLWKKHYNPVYRLAGLLLTYVSKLDNTL